MPRHRDKSVGKEGALTLGKLLVNVVRVLAEESLSQQVFGLLSQLSTHLRVCFGKKLRPVITLIVLSTVKSRHALILITAFDPQLQALFAVTFALRGVRKALRFQVKH